MPSPMTFSTIGVLAFPVILPQETVWTAKEHSLPLAILCIPVHVTDVKFTVMGQSPQLVERIL